MFGGIASVDVVRVVEANGFADSDGDANECSLGGAQNGLSSLGDADQLRSSTGEDNACWPAFALKAGFFDGFSRVFQELLNTTADDTFDFVRLDGDGPVLDEIRHVDGCGPGSDSKLSCRAGAEAHFQALRCFVGGMIVSHQVPGDELATVWEVGGDCNRALEEDGDIDRAPADIEEDDAVFPRFFAEHGETRCVTFEHDLFAFEADLLDGFQKIGDRGHIGINEVKGDTQGVAFETEGIFDVALVIDPETPANDVQELVSGFAGREAADRLIEEAADVGRTDASVSAVERDRMRDVLANRVIASDSDDDLSDGAARFVLAFLDSVGDTVGELFERGDLGPAHSARLNESDCNRIEFLDAVFFDQLSLESANLRSTDVERCHDAATPSRSHANDLLRLVTVVAGTAGSEKNWRGTGFGSPALKQFERKSQAFVLLPNTR